MTAKSSRAVWTTGLLAAITAATSLVTAPPTSALSGTDAQNATYAFTAKINVADHQACSGVLVDPQWVLTAASCFADGGKPAPAGKPALKTTVTVGRTDLTGTGGAVEDAVELVPRADRDVVMVKLAHLALGVTPVKLAASGPAAGEQLTATGFGRTKTEWVPDKLHSAAFTVASVAGGDVSLDGPAEATVCQGDAGGPALRVNNGVPELVAINSRSWQGGCLGIDPNENRTGAVDVRVDDLADWIRQTALHDQGDITGDGIADLFGVTSDGGMHVYPGDAAKGLSGEDLSWFAVGPWQYSFSNVRLLAKGDFNGDGKAEVMAVWDDGTLHLYDGKFHPTTPSSNFPTTSVPVTYGGSSWSTVRLLTAGDFDGDGIADLMAVWNDGTLHFYKGKGDGQIEPWKQVTYGGSTWTTVRQLSAGDFTGNGVADLMAIWNDGTVHLYKGDGKGEVAPGIQIPYGGNTWSKVLHLA